MVKSVPRFDKPRPVIVVLPTDINIPRQLAFALHWVFRVCNVALSWEIGAVMLNNVKVAFCPVLKRSDEAPPVETPDAVRTYVGCIVVVVVIVDVVVVVVVVVVGIALQLRLSTAMVYPILQLQ